MVMQPSDPPRPAPSRRRISAWLLRGWRFSWGQVFRLLALWVLDSVALGITIGWVGGISASQWWSVPIAALVVAVVASVLRPVLGALAVALSWFGVFVIGLLSQAVVMFAGLHLTPGIEVTDFASTIWASWVYALVATVLAWLFAVDEEEAFIAYCVRRASRARRAVPDGEQAGVVFVQLDGLPAPVLDWGLRSGNLPTMSRWVRSGSHHASGWRARVPSTTPASQAGLLHGRNENMPAFRWYEKDTGRLLVANRTADAAEIQRRVSDGRGLLADDGVSISNLFSGDAPVSLLSMSGMAEKPATGLGPASSYASFFTHPVGFARAFLLTIGEMVKELYQARRQQRHGIEPRVHRRGAYVALRAVTNVMLRDLNVALVIEQMMQGRKAIYVDFVDYDEIAHHAGPTRPEALRSLEGLDQVLGQLERVAAQAPRLYHFVVLSDHGQSQGATFLQRYGVRLHDLVRDLMGSTGTVVGATSAVEEWGPVNAFLSQLTQEGSVSGGLAKQALRGRSGDGVVALGPAEREVAGTETGERPELVVCGSGNLGLVYFARYPERLTYERIEELWPGLVATLAHHEGVSFVVVMSGTAGALAIGRHGVHQLDHGRVEGEDPLAPFGPFAAVDMHRCAHFPNAPDIYLNSCYDPDTGEVAAFEELVGSHGGLGGWQDQAVLVHPAAWPLLDDHLVGADAVHRQLVDWLERLGHRGGWRAGPRVAVEQPQASPPRI